MAGDSPLIEKEKLMERIDALESALAASSVNEKAIFDVWGDDPLQQLLSNLEAQKYGPKDLVSAARQLTQVKERRAHLLLQEIAVLKAVSQGSFHEELMTLRHEVAVLRKKCMRQLEEDPLGLDGGKAQMDVLLEVHALQHENSALSTALELIYTKIHLEHQMSGGEGWMDRRSETRRRWSKRS